MTTLLSVSSSTLGGCFHDGPVLASLTFQWDTFLMPTDELKDDANRYLMATYARQPLSIVKGRGTKVYDLEGREYIDFVAGIAVNLLGHGHPDLIHAIQRPPQPPTLTSNLSLPENQGTISHRPGFPSVADKVFFCNSG